jgi:Pyridoxamine 5'-phosphate oxidase
VIQPFPQAVRDVLDRGALCHLAAASGRGLHLTPVVFSVHASRLWVTTSRSSVKARAWKRDPRVGGLVRSDGLAVSFTGRVRALDVLDPSTWLDSASASPTLAVAAAGFTLKNARFFAGYAVDARHVPLSWTPPGRVFAGIGLETAVLVDIAEGRVVDSWSAPRGGAHEPRRSYRSQASGWDLFSALPPYIAERVGRAGEGALAVDGPRGPVVLPVRWAAAAGSAVHAASPTEVLAIADWPATPSRVALAVDRASAWRARAMTGVLIQGKGSVYLLDELSSGRRSAERIVTAAGTAPEGAALVRVSPDRAVWWRGWASGTVAPS